MPPKSVWAGLRGEGGRRGRRSSGPGRVSEILKGGWVGEVEGDVVIAAEAVVGVEEGVTVGKGNETIPSRLKQNSSI